MAVFMLEARKGLFFLFAEKSEALIFDLSDFLNALGYIYPCYSLIIIDISDSAFIIISARNKCKSDKSILFITNPKIMMVGNFNRLKRIRKNRMHLSK